MKNVGNEDRNILELTENTKVSAHIGPKIRICVDRNILQLTENIEGIEIVRLDLDVIMRIDIIVKDTDSKMIENIVDAQDQDRLGEITK